MSTSASSTATARTPRADAFNRFPTGLDHPGDGNAMGRYLERYVYDDAGNFLDMQHVGSDPAHPGWTRTLRATPKAA